MKDRFFFLIFFLTITVTFAQTNKEIALQKANNAIRLMDEGRIDESISILQESQELDPKNFDYPYEIAYANYLKKDYKKAIEIAEKLENYKNVNAQLYTLWGNSYDNLGNSKKAIEIYDLGIKKFPNKGIHYLEKGVVYEFEKDYNKAVETYQKGISVEPNYSSNYYRLANLYLNSSDKTPGLIYGEIFINLERTTKRTKEISEKLFDTYKNSVTFTNENETKVDFCKELVIDATKYENDKKLPLCTFWWKFYFGINKSKGNQSEFTF